MSKWIEYTGSDKQIEKLASAKTMVRVRYANGQEVNWTYTLFKSEAGARAILETAIAYLISEPHPCADMIKIWADTGCEVWVRYMHRKGEWDDALGFSMFDYLKTESTNEPNWNIPGAEYRLTPFED